MEPEKRDFGVNSPEDMLRALARADTDAARAVLARAREEENGHREEVAHKLVTFFEAKERMIAAYVAARADYPQLATLLEENNPFLEELYDDAVVRFERHQRARGSSKR